MHKQISTHIVRAAHQNSYQTSFKYLYLFKKKKKEKEKNKTKQEDILILQM